jgi:hypothetical protein
MGWQFILVVRHRVILPSDEGLHHYTACHTQQCRSTHDRQMNLRWNITNPGYHGLLVIVTTIGLAMAFSNIKKLQHRFWILRAMIYLSSIITTPTIMAIATQIITVVGPYHVIMTSGELGFIYHHSD